MKNQNDESITPAPIIPVIAEFKSFSFTNPQGGTGMSNWNHDARFTGAVKVQIVKAWNDYETGLHFVGVALDDDLIAYLRANAKADEQRVYVSEHTLIKPASGQMLLESFAESVGVVLTEDGYVLRKQPNGTWSDSDMSFTSLRDLMAEVNVSVEI